MKHVFVLNGCPIEVFFQEHSVHITNNQELWKLVGANPKAATEALVGLIFTEFSELYDREFEIHPDSLIVEVWGHVYFEYMALILDNLVKLNLLTKVLDKLISYCEVIDCGEKGYDNNRSLWDMLAPFTSLIAGWLPENINDKNLKRMDNEAEN
jgi:hypothetical protein